MEFLLEINTEEMPPSHVKTGLVQLRDKLKAELEGAHIAVNSMETDGTCRRLVLVGDFAERQEDKEEVVIGPPKAAAFAADGSPTAAARGFARAQNADVDRLEVIATPKGEYLGLRRTLPGKPVLDILAAALPGIITSLSFPKMMKWGTGSLRFSRPIKNILCLCGGKPLRFSVDRIQSSGATSGHRLHAPRRFAVKSFREYKSLLLKNRVILAASERRRRILAQIEKKLKPLRAELYPDEQLLEKVTYDVEHPHVIRGSFPAAYLKLPLEVLSVAMREGQKLFSVVREGRQLPYFLGVADALGDPKSLIRKGNERVLKARLEDARFFWEQDLKIPLARRAARLGQVVFQEKLGTYADKTERLIQIVSHLCDKLDEKALKKDVVAAAELSKVDLLTEMVREFPSLQGRVGGLYAAVEGYPQTVWRAVYEHYQPISLEDSVPASLAGALLSLADKLDSIVGVVGIGVAISGSSDPFGLRRNAHGACKIILDGKLDFSFGRLVEKAIAAYGGILEREAEEVAASCSAFFEQRLRFIYETQGYRYDLINAAMGAGLDNIYHSFLRLRALDALKKSPQFEPLILMAKRVNNILRGLPNYELNADLFAEKEERELHSTLSIVRENIRPLLAKGEFLSAQSLIFKLEAPLGVFFDRVLVMAEDKQVRQNRLALLQEIREVLSRVADYSRVVVEGERAA
jgi:glycyl-tRNA synthetase beta chain